MTLLYVRLGGGDVDLHCPPHAFQSSYLNARKLVTKGKVHHLSEVGFGVVIRLARLN
jgi:hypothetical protein